MKFLLTIVTVTYNAEKHLDKTMDSVSIQTVRDKIEFLIVDGASKDGTLDILNRREKEVDKWLSEKDGGIYDAMNKAIRLARGEWIIFMNAGDVFENPNTVESMKLEECYTDFVYGDCSMIYPNGRIVYDRSLPVEKIGRRMICSHQSLFARKSVLAAYPFNLKYTICGDFNQLGRAFKDGRTFLRKEIPVGKVELEKYTWRQIREGHRQKALSSWEVFERWSDRGYFWFRGLNLALRHLAKKFNN